MPPDTATPRVTPWRRPACSAGYYIPVRPSPQSKDFDALKKAAKQISDMLRQSGVSEDEIVADFQKARSHTSQA
jgi:hypothetical protein